MKIKGSSKKLKINSAFFVFFAGTLAALGIRLVQAFSGLIDFETGFFTMDSIANPLLYIVLGITAIAVFAISFLSAEVPQDKMPEKKSPVMTLFSGLFAISLAFSAVNQIEAFKTMADSYNPFYTEQTLVSYLMKSGALPRLGEGVFAALSIIYFIILVFKYSGLREFNLTKIKALSLCPLFWATFRMIQRFTRTISFMNVSSLFLELFMIAFMMMFFMYLAQMSSEVNNRAISYKVFAYGLISSMFAAVVSIPKALLAVFDSSYREMMNAGTLECVLEPADLGFCLFAVAFLALCLTAPRIKNMTLKETEKMIEEEK